MKRKVKRGFKKSPPHVSQKRLLQETMVYLMHSTWIFVSKFGVTDYAKARVKNVSDTTSGYVFYIFPPTQIPFGWQAEQFVHLIYCWANVPFDKGSGRNEWFVNVNPVICFIIWYFGNIFGWTVTIEGYELPAWVCFILSPIIWLDGLFWYLAFVVFWWSVAIAGLVGVIFMLRHL